MVESSDDLLIKQAAQALSLGKLVAFPTETVYGLGADATNPAALELLYKVKGRPASHPCIVHLASPEQVGEWATDVPEAAQVLADMFWPGPLTMVLKKTPAVSPLLTGGQETIALRIPDHKVALRLLEEFGKGIAAPSANRFGKLSATLAQDVELAFGDEVEMVLDGGPCRVGIESTIIDLSGKTPAILRPGMILKESIEAVLSGLGIGVNQPGTEAPRVPGSLPAHYAPSKPIMLLPSDKLAASLNELASKGSGIALLSFQKPSQDLALWIQASQSADTFAHTLYKHLRTLDASSADLLAVESPPDSPEWTGVNDRLLRAAGSREKEAADGS